MYYQIQQNMFSDLALSQNEDRALLNDDHKSKLTVMAKHMKQIEHDKKLEVSWKQDVMIHVHWF